jgi:transposase
VAEAGERLEPSVAALGQAMVAAPLAHADETGMRGEGKLHWRHVLATGWLSWIGLHAPRGQKAFEAPERLAHFRTL